MTEWTREKLQALADGPLIDPSGHLQITTAKSGGGYSAPPGTGPEGETCKSCKHLVRVETGARRIYRKCGLQRHRWTHGPGTDIKASALACRCWEEKGR